MSLYHEAAKVLDGSKSGKTSIKSLVYTKKDWKSDPKALFALSTEAAKWSEVLSEVIERSGVLRIERQLTPTLALILTHDLFLSKRGIALPATHGLNSSISKHKARLSAELTKARLRRGFATLDAFRAFINNGSVTVGDVSDQPRPTLRPRWVRINTLRTTLDEQLGSTFAAYQKVASLDKVMLSPASNKVYCVDEHIPNLVAIPSSTDITTSKAYRTGQLILQDKASCFPAYLLSPKAGEGDVMDACAAPGNKTTHVAAVLGESMKSEAGGDSSSKVFACEKGVARSETLEKMVELAGASDVVTIKAKQDFTKLPPTARAFANTTALLLDPSCSGSGIVGRDESSSITVHLPSKTADFDTPTSRGKKRKRAAPTSAPNQSTTTTTIDDVAEEQAPADATEETADKLAARLANLSAFQLRLLLHAMAFPAARRIAYSTCSIHAEENEHVVVAALRSSIALEQGWRIMKRTEQVEGMRKWNFRGKVDAVQAAARMEVVDGETMDAVINETEVAEACIRCDKNGEDGTMGFFVVGFVRDEDGETMRKSNGGLTEASSDGKQLEANDGDGEEEAWEGFDD
ncbi:hypothetical protein LTS10_003028 [Elasticomyces elasticus]|nr:hypothetical protein LTS10_003028 [Elasticomyces elasticus]